MSTIEIKVYFHKAVVSGLYPHISIDGEKHFSTFVDFGENPINGTSGVMVDIPAKHYTKQEFILAVIKETEEHFSGYFKEREKNRQAQKEKERFEQFTKEVAEELGLKPSSI